MVTYVFLELQTIMTLGWRVLWNQLINNIEEYLCI